MGGLAIPAIKGGVIGAILIYAVIALFSIIFETNKPMSLGGFFRLVIVWACIAVPVIFAIIGALSIKMSGGSIRNLKDACMVSLASGLLAIVIVLVTVVIVSSLSPDFSMSDALSGLLNPFSIIIVSFFSLISMAGGLIYFKLRGWKGA